MDAQRSCLITQEQITVLLHKEADTVEGCNTILYDMYVCVYYVCAYGQFRGDGRTVRTLVFGVYKI